MSAQALFESDAHGFVIRRPAWLCACGTTIHPAISHPGGTNLDRTPPGCPTCAQHGRAGAMRQVTIRIDHGGWAS